MNKLNNTELSCIDDAKNIFEETSMYLNGKRCIPLERSADDLMAYDVITAIFIGAIGSATTTSEKLNRLLDDIHTDASLKKPKTLLGMLLHHTGDEIDSITRGGKAFATYLHRLYGGHDILSLKGDNPFVVLCRQYGIPKGILQAIRHLVSDTFSKNGGVLPGSSFLDFVKSDGTVGNYLDEWAKDFAHGNGLSPQEVYSKLFSIRMQDIGATTVTNTLINLYAKSIGHIKGRKPLSRIGVSQLKIIALLTTVIGSAGAGIVIYHGVPKINIPAIAALSGETVKLLALDNKDIKALHKKNQDLEERMKKIEYSLM